VQCSIGDAMVTLIVPVALSIAYFIVNAVRGDV
jgi:hypothetical protein